MEPERAHEITLSTLRFMGSSAPTRALLRAFFAYRHPALEVEAFGLKFSNPIGLAAGYDKNASAVAGLACLGFGHLEIGTITPRPQAGYPRPRIWRLEDDRGLINRMGFPNDGLEAVRVRLRSFRSKDVRIGINIGVNAETPIDRAADDYGNLMRAVSGHADYLAINISSPNTPGLRDLQRSEKTRVLLQEISRARALLASERGRTIPMLIKIGPDLKQDEIKRLVDAALEFDMNGIIATNTTTSRASLRSPNAGYKGGLSGQPLRWKANRVIETIAHHSDGQLDIVGVGGISGPTDAEEKLRSGAKLLQIYTGLVYQGPGLIRQLLKHLVPLPH
jgi:dihydroorotate dehydrogenase